MANIIKKLLTCMYFDEFKTKLVGSSASILIEMYRE